MTVFLDACAIIYWVEGPQPWRERVQAALKKLREEAGDFALAVSALSHLECGGKPLRDGDYALLARYGVFFGRPDVSVIALDNAVIDAATEMRAAHGLKTPDALQAACALGADSDVVFLSNDRRFSKLRRLRTETV